MSKFNKVKNLNMVFIMNVIPKLLYTNKCGIYKDWVKMSTSKTTMYRIIVQKIKLIPLRWLTLQFENITEPYSIPVVSNYIEQVFYDISSDT